MFELSSGRPGRHGRRSWTGVSASVALHFAVGFGAVAIINMVPAKPPRFVSSALTFMAVNAVPPVPPESNRLQVPAEVRLKPDTTDTASTPPVLAPEIVENKQPETQPQLPITVRLKPDTTKDLPLKVDVPKPAQQVTVGAFAENSAPARTAYANRQVDAAGFDAPAAQTAQLKTREMALGSFDTTPANNAKPGTDRPVGTLVADAGFGRTAVAAAQPASARTVGDAGFGGADSPGLKSKTRPTYQQVQAAGFADAQTIAATASKPVRSAERIDIPMEVLSKPTPVYTAEARDLKLEGEVALEVEFCAGGSVRVLRVVRGLGHGLDEAATRAAENIRFKPAQSHGRAVDFRTTVHITFRLT